MTNDLNRIVVVAQIEAFKAVAVTVLPYSRSNAKRLVEFDISGENRECGKPGPHTGSRFTHNLYFFAGGSPPIPGYS